MRPPKPGNQSGASVAQLDLQLEGQSEAGLKKQASGSAGGKGQSDMPNTAVMGGRREKYSQHMSSLLKLKISFIFVKQFARHVRWPLWFHVAK